MTQGQSGEADIHALLIGIDHYQPHQLDGGFFYPSLAGAVRDVEDMATFLKTRLKVPQDRIEVLVARNSNASAHPDAIPTRRNIVAALERLTRRASAGSQVYIHYSGHGGRVPTRFADVKGEQGLDETLVPTDVGEAGHIRDIELAHLLTGMVDKDLEPFVVLDCCHAGGALRDASANIRVRGIPHVDRTDRSHLPLVADEPDLVTTWRRLNGPATRAVSAISTWPFERDGYALLAACAPHEFALESDVGGRMGGLLTDSLLRALAHLSPGFSYGALHDRVLTEIQGRYYSQTPMLMGDTRREVFGSRQVSSRRYIDVLGLNRARRDVTLGAGAVHGVRVGASVTLFPASVADPIEGGSSNVYATVDRVESGRCRAKLLDSRWLFDSPSDAKALLTGVGDASLLHKIGVQEGGRTEADRVALEALCRALDDSSSGFITSAPGGSSFDFGVCVDARGYFVITGSAGTPIPNLPAVRTSDPDAASTMVRHLEHIARYTNVLRLENPSPPADLAGKLAVEIVGPLTTPARGPSVDGASQGEGRRVFGPDERIELRIANNSSRVLKMVVLDLQPEWGIEQIEPSMRGAQFVTIDPGYSHTVPMITKLPEDVLEATDVMKVIASVESTRYRWLELPSLKKAQTRAAPSWRGTPDPLEAFFAATTNERHGYRHVQRSAAPMNWITEQIAIHVARAAADPLSSPEASQRHPID